MSETSTNGQSTSPSEAKPPTIRWDASSIKNAYANVCNVASTQEEVVLNFGLNQAWERESRDVQVQLTNRIILSPFAAKRLALLLPAVMQQYEARYGPINLTAVRPDAPAGSNSEPATAAPAKPHAVKWALLREEREGSGAKVRKGFLNGYLEVEGPSGSWGKEL